MDLDAFLGRFTGLRPLRPGRWTAACPAHEDDSRDTLSISLGSEARRLLYCFAGCPTDRVVDAAGLTMRDLFDPAVRPAAPAPTYRQLVADEIRRLESERSRRYGPYHGGLAESAAIRAEYRAARAARAIAHRRDPNEALTWELLECAAEWEREAERLSDAQDQRLTAARTPRG